MITGLDAAELDAAMKRVARGMPSIGDLAKTLSAASRPMAESHQREASAVEPAAFKLNADRNVAVSTEVYWNPDMTTCPRGVKVQLLGAGGVATYGSFTGDKFWQGWAPVPKKRRAT